MNEAQMAQALLTPDRLVILTHRRPDGDTVGSAAALCLALRQAGKQAWVLENPQLTDKYRPFLNGLTRPDLAPDLTVVAVDIAAEEMLPLGFPAAASVALAIDHHSSNSAFAARSLVRPASAACGEIVYDLLRAMGATLTRQIAEALYVAIATDTGCFRYSNVTANTFRVAAALLEAGPDTYAINRTMFEVKSRGRLRLESYLTRTMAFYGDGRIGVCIIPANIRQELSLTEDDVDDISDFARKIDGVELAAMLRELPDGDVKISLRSDLTRDSGKICALLGGGGHFCAAGASVHGTPDEAVDRLLAAVYALYPALR